MGLRSRAILFAIACPGTITVLLPLLIAYFHWFTPLYVCLPFWSGIPFIVIGGYILLSNIARFAYEGQGTLAPVDPPKILVAGGLYRRVRNPMYVGVMIVLAGETLMLGSTWIFLYAWVVLTLFHLFVVFYEEPHLAARFGESYEEYRRTTPRWIPRMGRLPP